MTIAERSATAIVKSTFAMLVRQEGYAGPNFNAATFDIEKHVDVMLFTSYRTGKVPAKSRAKALKLARTLWDALREKEAMSRPAQVPCESTSLDNP